MPAVLEGCRRQVGSFEPRLVGDASQYQDYSDVGQELPFRLQVSAAVGKLRDGGFVAGWSASGGGGYEAVLEFQPVVASAGVGLIGESVAVERLVKPISARVPGEHATGAVRSVGGGRQSHYQQSPSGVSEPGHGLSPVSPVSVGLLSFPSHPFPVSYEARASGAYGKLRVQALEGALEAARVPHDARFAISCSRSSRLRILRIVLLGSSVRNSMNSGTLYGARRSRQWALSSSTVAL